MSANSEGIVETVSRLEAQLGERLARLRLSRNLTRDQLAKETGVSSRTLARLEAGQGASLDSFIRALLALNMESNLLAMLPDPAVRPIERVKLQGRERQRARPVQSETKPASEWAWGDDEE
ncbi:helix-turn-helix domain-containing protein [Asticcacaulis sp. W401b]|uniref:helix-turn-helix domain-containing protein n=1 Tax=Asticcacaulis sp. W401b TaxID=3388666 RepID=UPI003970D733